MHYYIELEGKYLTRVKPRPWYNLTWDKALYEAVIGGYEFVEP